MLNEYGERTTIDIPTTDPSQFMTWYERSYGYLVHQAVRKECLYWAEAITYWQRTPDTATFICNHDGGARGWIVTHLTQNLFQTISVLDQVTPSQNAVYHAQVKATEVIVRKLADLIIEEDQDNG